MQVLGTDRSGRPVVSKPSGLEQLDREEILRHRYLGVFGDPPKDHFIGGSDDITFGGNGGAVGTCWRRTVEAEHHKYRRDLWREAYHEIGRLCDWLSLPTHIREEITRVYANLRQQGLTQRTVLEKQLARVTYLACLVHRLPRSREDLERGIRELYGFGFGRIFPPEFVRALNTRQMRFFVQRIRGKPYLYVWETMNGKRIAHRCLGSL